MGGGGGRSDGFPTDSHHCGSVGEHLEVGFEGRSLVGRGTGEDGAACQDDVRVALDGLWLGVESAVFKDIAGKDWEQRVSEYYDSDSGTIDDVIRVVDTDMNRVYNDSVLDVGEKANRGRVELPNTDAPVPDATGRVMKTWVTMADDRVRDTHDYLEGMSVPINERFFTFDNDYATAKQHQLSLPNLTINGISL